MANDLYRTYEVLVEESIHPDHPKRAKDKTKKQSVFNAEIDGALRDTHMIFQDAVCFNTLCFAGLAGLEVHKSGEREGELLNPLWKHLTTPAAQGGIKEETDRMIRRLATHYKPLKAIKTADEFLNCVYSEPLQTRGDMSEAQKTQVRQLRAKCYRILEMFGAPAKEGGGQECADMSAFANNWTGLTSKPESDTEIPGNLAYDCVCRELKKTLPDGASEDESRKAAAIIEETLLRYSEKAEKRNKADCENKHLEKLEDLKKAVAEAEGLPDADIKKAAKLKKAKTALARHEDQKEKEEFEKDFFANRREGLENAVVSALSKPFAADKASDVGLSEDEFAATKNHISKIVIASEMKAKDLIRLHYKGGNPGLFEKAMFRYWVLRKDADKLVNQAALADFRKFIKDDKPDVEPKLDDEHIAEMPFRAKNAKIAFPLFGKMCLEIETIHSSPNWDFDKTAYATAAEDVFKYKIRTDTRARKVQRLLNVVKAYEGQGVELPADLSPTGKRLTIHGMKDDPRWKCDDKNRKGVVQLLTAMSSDKEIGGYGLREGTIGGWAEVRKALLAVHRKAPRANDKILDETTLVNELEKAVDDEMEANRQGFGSADLFHALCDPAYFHLWLEGSEYESNGVKDFLPHYVGYCEQREELIELLRNEDGSELDRATNLSASELEKLAMKSIRYTWPGLLNRHKKPSYRYYDFTEKLNTKLPLKLFRRVRPTDDRRSVKCYELMPAEQSVLTLAARRLKRDKIINKDTGNSVDALWCPPLILAGEPKPTKENHPRAGKYEDAKKKVWPTDDAEVSFSLIACPLPGDYWDEVAGVPFAADKHPIHLTVSFKIEANALALLQKEGVHFVGGSLKGVDEEDEKRKFFRWPVDIETDKVAAAEAAAKAKREGERSGKPPQKSARKADIKPIELWCHGEGGFRVKESRYSKAEKTKLVPDFQILSIDLGNRFAAAFARMRIHAQPNGDGRIISADGFSPVIKADIVRQGTLRLQGENAKVWQHVREADGTCKKDSTENYVYVLEDEEYGNQGRGRFPKDDEYTKFSKLAGQLAPVESLSLSGKEKETYPELADHLVFRLKRRIGRLRTLLNLVWRLCAKHERNQRTGQQGKEREEADRLFHRRMTVETLAHSLIRPPRQLDETEDPKDSSLRAVLAADEHWKKLKDDELLKSTKGADEKNRCQKLEAMLKDDTAWNWNALAEAVKKQIEEYMEGVPGDDERQPLDKLLIKVIEFCLPLRGRHWGWDRSRKARLHWDNKDDEHTPHIMGMRGLSMKRLEQISNLRQRCQSFAKLEDRYHGSFKAKNYNPPDPIAREAIDDVCPLLLDRSNRIREQRVDQAAHLILAEALGMELKSPEEVKNKKERKAEVDLHGEYKRRKDKNGKEYPRCSVIVLENLERYKTSQERTKTENSRLMKWAHRAIIEKLEDMCRPFGITLMLVDPAFTSHFDSRTGLLGVRVNEVSRDFEKQYPYAKWVNDKTKSGKPTKLAEDIKKLAAEFETHKDYKGKLVLAVEGGTDFVSVLAPLGGKDTFNADITAAVNIGLRAVADPQRWDIFPRLRTKRKSETKVSVTNWRGWFALFEKEEDGRTLLAATDKTVTQTAISEKPSKKKTKKTGAGSGDNDAETASSQSSEFPPFFVQHPKHDWLFENDWLKKDAFKFQQGDKELLAYPQGAYLKRVEQECTKRIETINNNRIHKPDVM